MKSIEIKLSKNHNLKMINEMIDLFSDLPEALENNFNLPYKCNYKPLPSKPLLPEYFRIMKLIQIKLLDEAVKGLQEKFETKFNKKNQNQN